jgi:hypothetical protein
MKPRFSRRFFDLHLAFALASERSRVDDWLGGNPLVQLARRPSHEESHFGRSPRSRERHT